MSNGTKNPFPGYGYGYDKPIVNYFGSRPVSDKPFGMFLTDVNTTKPYDPLNPLANLGIDFTSKETPATTGGRPKLDPVVLPDMTISVQDIADKYMLSDIGKGDTQVAQEFYVPPVSGGNVAQDISSGGGGGTGEGGFGSRFAGNLGSPQAMGAMASGVGGILQGLIGRGKRRAAQAAAQAEHDRMRQQYAELDTSNLYANVENKYMNLENTFEDLTINKQQAEFERNMFERQQASIMSGLSAAAGGSGIAGLAQAMAQQSQIAGQRAAGSIGMQEYKNQILSATEASKIQRMERAGEAQAEAQRLAGAETARSLDYRKTTTQLGMSQQELAAANQAIATADAALYGGIGKVAGTVVSAGIGAIPSPS
tara:strand:- start:45 stop:1148 length:1104 start_codon:yes stop_codon:yes gene_type:complete